MEIIGIMEYWNNAGLLDTILPSFQHSILPPFFPQSLPHLLTHKHKAKNHSLLHIKALKNTEEKECLGLRGFCAKTPKFYFDVLEEEITSFKMHLTKGFSILHFGIYQSIGNREAVLQ